MIEDADQLRRRQAHVQRHYHRVRLDDAVIAFEKLVVIEAEIRDSIAGPDSPRVQRRRQPFTTLAELSVSEAPRSADYPDFSPVQIHRAMHAADRRQGHDHEFSLLC